MRKYFLLAILVILLSFPVMASGFYFDIGFGLGGGWTFIDGNNFLKELEKAGVDVSTLGVNLDLKAGYGPFGRVPLFIVGNFGGIGHRIYDKNNYIQFNSYIAGAGVIFYPIKWLQLALDAGMSWGVNQTDIPGIIMYNTSGIGFAWDVSIAADLGGPKHGFLIGLKYIAAYNTLETSKADINSSVLGIFFKYAYRNKL